MVLPAKIFEIKEKIDTGIMIQKLKNFREEEPYEAESGEKVSLVSEILDLRLESGVISGVFSRDYVRTRFYKRKLIEALVTEEAPFWIRPFGERLFLIVLAPSVARGVKKLLTGNVANTISRILFIRAGAVVEARIPHETLRELHESNPQATKLIWFDEVDIPGVEKLCLAGSDIVDTELYHEYLKHGKIWYVVFEVQRRGLVVGITRNCVVTLFSRSTIGDFIRYIQEDILKLIQ
ncbi:MAG: hypothetical protein AYL33_005240 [Candidatus Bathyarchaeota archaeon B63]|nr:MAG: hypothetical protein AYL33_005240 [Candidatus Bathyarchaeota archaeon B63]